MFSFFALLFTDTPLKYFVQSMWRDEAFSYLLAKQNIIKILLTTAKDANPPLYYLILHFWMGVFGTSEVALRTLSFLFFLGTLYIAGMFLLEIFRFSVKKTLQYLLLFVLNPVLQYYAFETRMYSLFALLAVLSFYYLYKRKFRLYILFTILGLYTHYFMIFAVLSQITYLIIMYRYKVLHYGAMYMKIGLLFIPWLILVVISKPPIDQGFWIAKPNLFTYLNLPALLLTGYEDQYALLTYRLLPFLTIFLYGMIFYVIYKNVKSKKTRRMHIPNVQEQNSLGLYLFCWVVVPVLMILSISFFKPLYLPRYIIFITVGLIFLLIFVIQKVHKSRLARLFFILLFIASFFYSQMQVINRHRQNLKRTLIEINKSAGKKDYIYVTNELFFHTAQYYIPEKQVFIYGKNYEQIPWYVGKVLIPKDRLKSSLPVYPRKAYILKDDLSVTIQALY